MALSSSPIGKSILPRLGVPIGRSPGVCVVQASLCVFVVLSSSKLVSCRCAAANRQRLAEGVHGQKWECCVYGPVCGFCFTLLPLMKSTLLLAIALRFSRRCATRRGCRALGSR